MANGPSVLSRIGQGALAFGSGQSRSQIGAIRANRELADQDVQLQQQDLEANQRALDKDQRRELLTKEAFGGGPDSDQAKAQLAVEFPEDFEQIAISMGLNTQGKKNEAADFSTRTKSLAFDQRRPIILNRIAELEAAGRDSSHTRSLLDMTEQDQNDALSTTELLALTPEQRFNLAQGGATSETRTSAARAEVGGFTPEQVRQQARIEAGIDPRAGLSAAERIAADAQTTADVAGSQAAIAGATAAAKTDAQIQVELDRAEEVGGAEARKAVLVEAALNGERIRANRIKTAEEARVLLPEAQAGATEMVTLLNEIRNDPELDQVLGAVEGRIDFRFDEAEASLLAKIAQVTGKTFLQAYQSLKGGGPITDTEGRAATEAQSRLTNRTVSIESYQGAIDELIAITDARLARLTRKAGPATRTDQPAGAGGAAAGQPDLEFMTPEERALFE